MADVELLPCAECGMPCRAGEYHPFAACLMFKACHNSETVRANLAPLQAENERLRAEVDKRQALCEALTAALSSAEKSIERTRSLESARADRLVDALRVAAGELARIGDAIGHDHPEARRIFTLRANLLSARFAALAQEDRNG